MTKKKFDKVQRMACLGITGAMRTTPTVALNVLLGMPQLSSWVKKEAMASYLRLRDQDQWRARREEGHAKISTLLKNNLPLLIMKVPGSSSSCPVRRFSTRVPSREQWVTGEISFPQGSMVCFTDGSRFQRGDQASTGSGFCIEGAEVEESLALGKMATVFQAEVYAILSLAHRAEVKQGPSKIFICSDSLSAIKALTSPRASGLVEECANVLDKLASDREVQLVWVPGHAGVDGNERADTAARLGAELPFTGPEPAVALGRRQVKTILSEWAEKTLEAYWEEYQGGRQAKQLIKGPNRARAEWLLRLSRRDLRQVIGVLTGHCALRRHLHLLGVEQNPVCLCSQAEETAWHYLTECEMFGLQRYLTFGRGTLEVHEARSMDWTDLLSFIRKTRRFEETQ